MEENLQYEVYFHFDTNKHSIDPDLFIECVHLYKTALEQVLRLFTDKDIPIQIELLTTEEGSWLGRVKVYIASGMIALVINSEVANGFIKGLTGKTIPEWSETFGEYIRDTLSEDESKAKLIQDLTEKSLTRPAKEIEQIEGYEKLNPLWIKRNKTYTKCNEDKDIQGIGFRKDPVFPITRSTFTDKITIKENIEFEPYEILTVYVDQISLSNNTQWSGTQQSKDKDERIYFYCMDISFKEKIKQDKISIPTNLTVQCISIKDSKRIYAVHIIEDEKENYGYLSEKELKEKEQEILNLILKEKPQTKIIHKYQERNIEQASLLEHLPKKE